MKRSAGGWEWVRQALALLAWAALAAGTAGWAVPSGAPVDVAGLGPWADDLFARALKDRRLAGLALVGVQHGKVVLMRTYGAADAATGQTIDPATTRFRIGSVTKTMTALGISLLIERGRIRGLDDPANRYLRRIRLPLWQGREITVGDLLTHRGGFMETDWNYKRVSDPITPAELARVIPPQDVRSGQVSDYCNVCVAFAGVMIEDITHQRIDHFFEREIFAPAGMTGAVLNRTRVSSPLLARSYDMMAARPKPVPYFPVPEYLAPAGSVDATMADMARYLNAVLGHGGAFEPATLRRLFEMKAQNRPGVSGFGMSWMIERYNGSPVYEHGGALPGYHSMIMLFPDSDAGVFLTCLCAESAMPSAPGQPFGLTGYNFREMLLARLLGPPMRFPTVTVDLAPYPGLYERDRRDGTWPHRLSFDGTGLLRVGQGAGGLMVNGKGPYLPIGHDSFHFARLNAGDPYVPFPNLGTVHFMRDPHGAVVRVTFDLSLKTARRTSILADSVARWTFMGLTTALSLLGLVVLRRRAESSFGRLSAVSAALLAPLSVGALAACFWLNVAAPALLGGLCWATGVIGFLNLAVALRRWLMGEAGRTLLLAAAFGPVLLATLFVLA